MNTAFQHGEWKPRRREFIGTLGGAALATAARGLGVAEQATPRPNIVLIMADDMGFSDIGCYGGEIRTPNLNRLAANGLRFTQFYNTARCCPTRASLMTGLYPHQAGIGHMMQDKGYDGYRGDLNTSCVTIAEVLAQAGYGTYMSGKWHVTKHTAADGPKDNWPRQRGFDRFFGTINGAGSYYTPSTLTKDNQRIETYPEGFFYTDAISDNAAMFVGQHHASRPDDPFFLYVAFTAPHWPLHAPKEDVERYRGKYLKGWDALRAERRQRMVDMGLVDKRWALSPRDEHATAWEEISDEKKRKMALRMAVYAAQIDRLDQGVGRVVRELERTGRLDNTLIFFLADNGGCAEGGPWGFERKEGGVLGEDSSFASYGLSWANASNTPFRRYKHWVHEGGISSPLIVHWPARVKAHGEYRQQPGHVIDIMATCVDVARATYPTEYGGNRITPLEGKSLVPAFGNGDIDREAIYWEHEGNKAIRRGKWKLVSKHPGKWELYDLEADRTELNDLAAERPELVRELTNMWGAWAKRCGVRKWPVRGGRPKVGSTKTSFDLEQGQVLHKASAPNVVNRAVSIVATVETQGKDGVIVAQGGRRVGYSLYVKDGRLAFTLRRNREKRGTTVIADESLPTSSVEVSARLAKDGAIALTVDGAPVAKGKAPGPVNDMPDEELGVGFDPGGSNGEYRAPNEFGGKIAKVRIELGL